jgi:hypothetical protein
MKNIKNSRETAMIWWNNISSSHKNQLCSKYSDFLIGSPRPWKTLTGSEIESIWNLEIPYFKPGDKVRVTMIGYNASDFTNKIKNAHMTGVYSFPNWRDLTFTIMNEFEPIVYPLFHNIYGAYPLGFKGEIIGYVYNNAIKLVK